LVWAPSWNLRPDYTRASLEWRNGSWVSVYTYPKSQGIEAASLTVYNMETQQFEK
jgi:hypothetical protein